MNQNMLYRYLARIYCEPRSVVMFSDQFYKDYLHGVEYVSEEKLSMNKIFQQN